jgi:protein-L-isoaspartate O-methyltransferase
MVIPVGNVNQYLTLLVKEKDGVREEQVIPVRFVPMTGEAQAQE